MFATGPYTVNLKSRLQKKESAAKSNVSRKKLFIL